MARKLDPEGHGRLSGAPVGLGSRCVQGRGVSGVAVYPESLCVRSPGVSPVPLCPGSPCVQVVALIACHASYPDSVQPQPFHKRSFPHGLPKMQTWEGSIASLGMCSSICAPGRGGAVLQRAAPEGSWTQGQQACLKPESPSARPRL